MQIEMFLSIASFAISLGGLVSIFFFDKKEHLNRIVLTVVISALFVTTGVALYQHFHHKQLINRVQDEIVEKLAQNTWTFDKLYKELLYQPFPIVNEALFSAIEKGIIGDRNIEFRGPDGIMQQARAYYVKSP